MEHTPTAAEIGNACICLALRKTARLVARRYDAAFSELNLTSGQFSILAALSQEDPVAMGRLAATLGLERTTLTRNLKPLSAAGLVEERAHAQDARIRDFALTEAGRSLLARALPIWQRLQAQAAERVPERDWPSLRQHLRSLS